jgi:hypothetical protein
MDKKDIEKVEEGQAIAGQVLQVMREGSTESVPPEAIRKFAAENVCAHDFFERMSDESYLKDAVENYPQENKAEHAENLTRQIETKRKRVIYKHFLYAVSSAAAVIAVGFFFFRTISPVENLPLLVEQPEVPAVLMESGEAVSLLEPAGDLKIGNTIVEHTTANKIVYPASVDTAADLVPEYHTLIVPGKSVYAVVLSDGTEVTLNAGSRLTYPVSFTGDRREVQMEGEVCFNVAKRESQPFIATTGNISVLVLGTLFNMEAYPGEPVVTTLVRGKLEVSDGKRKRIIMPNQQAIISPGQFDVRNVSANEYVSWTTGLFSFTKTPLNMILAKLARWYDVEIVYATPSVQNIRFTLEIKRYDDIASILSKIEKSGTVRFKIEDKKIIVEELN